MEDHSVSPTVEEKPRDSCAEHARYQAISYDSRRPGVMTPQEQYYTVLCGKLNVLLRAVFVTMSVLRRLDWLLEILMASQILGLQNGRPRPTYSIGDQGIREARSYLGILLCSGHYVHRCYHQRIHRLPTSVP